ncbi:MAG: branched chain amino acid aminotransferase [Chloroflexi bacterium]|nr:MAG: branched chain amino acid aminotransferase [Chloroflexota bacterium]
MSIEPTAWIWYNGKLIPWDEARVHVFAHALHYGSSVFEGIRAYPTPRGPAVLGLEPHVRRLFDSCKIYRMPIPYRPEEISQAILETIRANELASCYIRPLVFRGLGVISLDPRPCPVEVIVGTIAMGQFLGEESLKNGIDVGVSTWQRLAPNTFPAMAKIGGQYINSQLIVMESHDRGFSEAIALNTAGQVSEGSGENVFIVKDGVLYTPSLAASILGGITRAFVTQLARDLGYQVREETIAREMLYLGDEAFFTGTAAEVTPIRSVDGIPVGEGQRGPVTAHLQEQFFGIVRGEIKDRFGWMTPVGE